MLLNKRKKNRRRKLERNLFAYRNRRDLLKRGRRKNEEQYDEVEDFFRKERDAPDPSR
jgi:hypothetical protein